MTVPNVLSMNGASKALVKKPATVRTYHGFVILDLRVDDKLPSPRKPERYAVEVYPDLARYLLTFNHPQNRTFRRRHITKYATDMKAGDWHLTPESLVFSTDGVLQNGQNRLMAVTEYGGPVWMLIDFGWPEDIISAIDRGAGRTNADAFRHANIANANNIAAAINRWSAYRVTVGSVRSWSGMVAPTASQAEALFEADAEAWAQAVHRGDLIYKALDKGLSTSLWAAAYMVIRDAAPDRVDEFFDELHEGSGRPRTPTRVLRDWCMRRPITVTRSGDNREPFELIVRAFNAWVIGRSFSPVRQPGFILSKVKTP